MNYVQILTADIINGDGFRVSLFVSGCARGCKGCFNTSAKDPNFGKPFDDKAKQKIFKELEKDWCKGLSLLGGDPMSKLSDNRKVIIDFCKEVKEKFPNKTIYMWTGYLLDEIKNDDLMKDILKYTDVIVDGPFVEELKDSNLVWKGSSNQNILYKGKDF